MLTSWTGPPEVLLRSLRTQAASASIKGPFLRASPCSLLATLAGDPPGCSPSPGGPPPPVPSSSATLAREPFSGLVSTYALTIPSMKVCDLNLRLWVLLHVCCDHVWGTPD
jgi:hypothetical protein